MSDGSDDRKASRTIWREWKARVRIVQLLEDIGRLAEFRVSGRRLIGPCPVHGGDNRRALSIDLQRDLWFCFTRCQSGGDVIDLAWHLKRAVLAPDGGVARAVGRITDAASRLQRPPASREPYGPAVPSLHSPPGSCQRF